jgi:protein-tyrosine phosphatase
MAVAAWKSLAALDLAHIEVASAGLAAMPGMPASSHSLAVARRWNVDLSTHQAQRLEHDLAKDVDLVCTMTLDAAHAVRTYFGATNVRSLGEFQEGFSDDTTRRLEGLLGEEDNLQRDIPDPFGGSLEVYEACGEEIRRSIMGLMAAIREGRVTA